MTFKQKIIYFFLTILFMLVLALFDFFVFKTIVDMFTTSWLGHTIVNVILIVLVNPLIIKYILNNIPFKIKGLKVEEGLKEVLKKETY